MKISKFGVFFLLVIGQASVLAHAWTTPAQVLIIRHGEKTADGNNLSPAGYARSEALVKVFETEPEFLKHGTPVAIYAMAPEDKSGSMRAIETVTPLVKSLRAEHADFDFVDTFKKEQTAQAAGQVMQDPEYSGKMVLMCWEHNSIAEILSTFGVRPMPPDWPDDVFGRVYEVDFNPDGTFKALKCRTELESDSKDCTGS